MDTKAKTVGSLREKGYRSRSVKQEMRENLISMLRAKAPLFPGIIGYDDTVIPQLVNAVLSKHDVLFLGLRGQAKSRLIRLLPSLLDEWMPSIAGSDLPDDPLDPKFPRHRRLLDEHGDDLEIRWIHRDDRYHEKLATPDVAVADLIGEIDLVRHAEGRHLSDEGVIHYGLIPRTNRGIFAINELPDLAPKIQVALFNALEERDVQIRGYPIRFDLDVVILFSANPATYNRSGKVIPQLKDRIGSIVRTHYPRERELGIEIMEQEAGDSLDGEYPVYVPLFMKEICEQITIEARKSDYIDAQSGVSARFSIANYRTMIASARRRAAVLGESRAIPRISDLGHLASSSMGKLELDLMSSHQMSEQQIIEAVQIEAVRIVFDEYADKHGLDEIGEVFGKGVKIEVGDMLPSSEYAERLERVPPAWEKAVEVNAARDDAVRASCVEFVLAGLYVTDRISRSQHHGRITYEIA